jgi:cyclopropane fatty-acyl-phospholipid synthase-like methyltransferase
MANDFVRQGFNRIVEEYDSTRNQTENNIYLDKVDSLLNPNSRILDIGCGAGLPIDRYFVDKGHTLTGIDISEKMIELAKSHVPEADYKVEDMSDLQMGEYHVDAVVSFYAIFHTPRETHQELLHKINSFLPQGGYLLITMASSEWEGKEDNFHGTEMFWSHYDSKKNRGLVEGAGFEILLDTIDGAGGEHHQIILARKR